MERTKRRRAGRRDFGTIKADGTPTCPAFSVRWYEGRKQRRKRGFGSRTDAEAFLARVRVELVDGVRDLAFPVRVVEIKVKDAIAAYGKHLADKGNKPGPMADTLYRLRTFFPDGETLLSELDAATCAGYYDSLRSRVTRTGKPYAVDSHRNILAEAKSLLKWCAVTKKWLSRTPLDGVEGKGKRKHGKPQLRIDEARRWITKATELADRGDPGAVAAMMALLLGARASEIITRVVRDLDDDGRQLWIPDSKTEAGRRTLRVPDVLRGYLQRLAADKTPEALIFGDHWRDWVRKWVGRICAEAGVPSVSAHSMRGLHATLAMEAGVTGHVVAASLGQESATTTIQSYAKPEAVASARQHGALKVLSGGLW